MKKIRIIMIGLLVPMWMFSGAAQALVIVLDANNGYLAELEPGVLLEQPQFTNTFNFITGTNLEFGIGGVFSGQTQIGNGQLLGGYKPKELVTDNIEFMILTSTGNIYNAYLTYFVSFQGGGTPFGTAPDPDNTAGAVFNIAVPLPEPGTLSLLSAGLLGLALMRRRRRA